jgi:hypothetical protein
VKGTYCFSTRVCTLLPHRPSDPQFDSPLCPRDGLAQVSADAASYIARGIGSPSILESTTNRLLAVLSTVRTALDCAETRINNPKPCNLTRTYAAKYSYARAYKYYISYYILELMLIVYKILYLLYPSLYTILYSLYPLNARDFILAHCTLYYV